MSGPKVLPPVEGPVFDDDDWPAPRPDDIPVGADDPDVLTVADLDELAAHGAEVDEADYAHARCLAGEEETADGLPPRPSWLGTITRPEDLPPCNPGMEWVFWPVDAPFFGVPFSAVEYLSRPLTYPANFTNREKLNWLALRERWANRRERLWADGSVERAQAEDRQRCAELDGLAGPAAQRLREPVADGEDVHFGHVQDILPPVARLSAVERSERARVNARFRRRHNWDAIAAALAVGMEMERIAAVHGVTIKAIKRARRRSHKFRLMVEHHRQSRRRGLADATEEAIAFNWAKETRTALADGRVREAIAMLRYADERAMRAEAAERRALAGPGPEVVHLGPDTVRIGSQRFQLVPIGSRGPVKRLNSAVPVAPEGRSENLLAAAGSAAPEEADD